ncbi:30S ribosomal protein S9 [Patescibacteria group bacterium]|nr:30S ribosomal protein S9 [Patescibacteria group bacterium]
MERKGRYFYANGKRKTSVARVRLYEKGKGDIVINNKPIDEYFFGTLIGNIKSPLKLTNVLKTFDITAKVVGGGISSQSDAVRHGIAKALLEYDPEFRSQLKKAGLLTRDSRVKERKKFGLKRARRAPQWAKR